MKLSQVIFKDSIIYGSIRYLQPLAAIFLTPIYTRIISKTNYGIIDIYLVWANLSTCIIQLGLMVSLYKFYNSAENEVEKKSVLGQIFGILIISNLLFVGIAFLSKSIFTEHIIGVDNPMVYETYILNIVIVSLSVINSFMAEILRLRFEKWKYVLLVSTNFFILTIFGFALVYYFNFDFSGFFWAAVSAQIIIFFMGILFVRNHITLYWSNKKTYTILKHSFPFVFANLMANSAIVIDRYFIKTFLSLTENGVYAISLKISGIVDIVTYSFNMAWYPFAMSIYKKAEAKSIYAIVSNIFVLICFFVIAGIVLFTKELILFFAPGYMDAYIVVLPKILTNVVFASMNIYTLSIHISGKTKNITVGILLSTVVNILLSLLFVHLFGLVGIVIAGFIASLLLVGYQYFRGKKYYPIDFNWTLVFLAFITITGLWALIYYIDFFLVVNSLVIYSLKIVLFAGFFFYVYRHVKRNLVNSKQFEIL